MSTQIILKITFLAILMLVQAASAFTQETPVDDPPQPENRSQMAGQPGDMKRDLLAQLGLGREQIQQIRKMHASRRPLMMNAQMHLRKAARALDDAIYAEQVNDTEVQARLHEFQAAQAEVAKLRFENELAVRRILTTEQLVRFRELRKQFEQARQRLQNGDPINGGGQFVPRRRRNRDRPLPPPSTPVNPDQ